MIVSASRRTDIPTFYSEWFYNRIKEGFLYVRNPMNAHQISRIDLSPDVVDCIVFWTKNPIPMLPRLDELAAYKYYFQFTLTGYGRDMEANLPDKKEKLIPAFKQLAEKIGKKRIIWRYDPIVFTKKYSPEYHIKAFTQIAEALDAHLYEHLSQHYGDIIKDIVRTANKADAMYDPEKDSYLHDLSMISLLSVDIYAKKKYVEHLVDKLRLESEDEARVQAQKTQKAQKAKEQQAATKKSRQQAAAKSAKNQQSRPSGDK